MRPLTVWILEDGDFTPRHIASGLHQQFPGSTLRVFETRLEIEDAWLNEKHPDAVIIDLLVIDQKAWLAKIVFNRWGRIFLLPALLLLGKWFAPYLKRLALTADKGLIEGRDNYWGGLEFIRSRILKQDQGDTPFYVYSMASITGFSARLSFAN